MLNGTKNIKKGAYKLDDQEQEQLPQVRNICNMNKYYVHTNANNPLMQTTQRIFVFKIFLSSV